MTTAFNIFLRQSIREGSLPFNVTINTPNAETVAALLEAERIGRDLSVKRYSDVEEALRELKS
jgi:DNA-damage-inducible protein J